MTTGRELYLQWQEAERAYRQERDRYFRVETDLSTGEVRLSPELVTPDVLARLAALRNESERLYQRWYAAENGT